MEDFCNEAKAGRPCQKLEVLYFQEKGDCADCKQKKDKFRDCSQIDLGPLLPKKLVPCFSCGDFWTEEIHYDNLSAAQIPPPSFGDKQVCQTCRDDGLTKHCACCTKSYALCVYCENLKHDENDDENEEEWEDEDELGHVCRKSQKRQTPLRKDELWALSCVNWNCLDNWKKGYRLEPEEDEETEDEESEEEESEEETEMIEVYENDRT
ncbi:hypothetical protein MMC20_002994 [Loxospora ochrophaea]|nr:hypothetical protein [Loxospora ochrophaea]